MADELSKLASQMQKNAKNLVNASGDLSVTPAQTSGWSPSAGGNEFNIRVDELLGGDPFRFSTFAYPRDVVNDASNGHYMLFYVNVQNKTKYSYSGIDRASGNIVPVGDVVSFPPHFTEGTGGPAGGGSRYIDKYTDGTGASEAEHLNTEFGYKSNQIKAGVPGNYLTNNMVELMKGKSPQTGMNSVIPTTTRITDSVAIYLPPNVEDKTTVTYQDFETGMAGFLALGGSRVIDKIINEDYEGAASSFTGLGGTLLVEALKKAAVTGVQTFTGGEGIQESFDKAFGQTTNPYIEVAFQSMGVRSFSYSFHFAPRSSQETEDVKNIINLFRFHMLPELKGSNHRYLTLPSTFDIHYMFQSGLSGVQARENSFYNKIATCVLTGVDVNYTPEDSVRSFDSGAPTQITMDLSFMETEMLTKQKVAQGY